jgi:D-3-phosphoglycerate dehydrogenase / 2-oxoglutarate reductase
VHPGEPDSGAQAVAFPLVALPGVYGTHHVGASTRQAENAIADEAVRIIRSFLERGEVPNCVNLSRRGGKGAGANCQLVVRHHDRVGVLANVLASLRRHEINVKEMDNQIFDGAAAACATIRLESLPPPECLSEIRSRGDEIIHAELVVA